MATREVPFLRPCLTLHPVVVEANVHIDVSPTSDMRPHVGTRCAVEPTSEAVRTTVLRWLPRASPHSLVEIACRAAAWTLAEKSLARISRVPSAAR